MAKKLIVWKSAPETFYLKDCHSQTLQQTLKDLDRALQDGFTKKKGMPKFKKKHQGDGFRYPQGCKIEGNKIFLPKIGYVKFRKSQEIVGKIKNVTLSQRAGKWYVSIQVEQYVELQEHPHKDKEIGIDLGVAKFATLSDGKIFEPVNAYKKYEDELGRAMKKLSRMTKGSKNREKQKLKIQKIHKKIADLRLDCIHKVSAYIAKNHGKVILEDLRVSNMSRSASGSIEKPGKNVSAKSGLNKSILDQGWYEFKRQLGYKLAWLGGELILVNPKNTSRKCFKCGHVAGDNRLSQAEFKCVSCGHMDNADVNAAKNILTVGQTGLACGSNYIGSRKQELFKKCENIPHV